MKYCILWVTFILLAACDHPNESKLAPVVSLHSELGGDASGYKRVCGPREFSFPADHAAHPEYRNEWWYITGNLVSDDGLEIGFHATFFRIANAPASVATSNSAWSASQFYMGHFALSVAGQPKVYAYERFSRAAAGLAGSSIDNTGTKVWIDDWSLQQNKNDGQSAWQLNVAEREHALQLNLAPQKQIVLQGNRGYSQKSNDPCNASYYYSIPRLSVSGNVVLTGRTRSVKGSAWFDREWSSSALADDQVGWDWFALQMDDGREIMFYQLRKTDGTRDPFSHAVVINGDGLKRNIPIPDVKINRWWQSDSGARYPIAGTLTFSHNNEVIEFEPLLDDQELLLTVRYWEGAIRLRNSQGKLNGQGYLELTGY